MTQPEIDRVHVTIRFPEQGSVTDVTGETITPTRILYESYMYAGKHWSMATLFDDESNNIRLPDIVGHDFPPAPAWFIDVAFAMAKQAKETADA